MSEIIPDGIHVQSLSFSRGEQKEKAKELKRKREDIHVDEGGNVVQ